MDASQFLLLLFIGYAVFTIDIKKNFFPTPPILVIIGIGLSFVSFFSSLEISQELLYEILLPALLYTSAYRYSLDAFK
ncbi:hypothetical protein [Bacillus sp. 2205SS5-2]|uniref:hypothetical protein n=1 Tax=Bacillus sp. 2205SS5-2 TaxID=3109031 RepID=UPI003003FA3F